MKKTLGILLLMLMLALGALSSGVAGAFGACATVTEIENATGQDVPDDVEAALADAEAQVEAATGQALPLC